MARGVAQQRQWQALVPAKPLFALIVLLTSPKRQPGGTGYRWPGAFGLIPGRGVRL
ncbi:hypothetical protein [uncultured Roseovarius sp.]|uniref:hypothetical protein n=1 Tax=uncultured Roseovarius sp. TaxID=293344 RepID=UPI002614C874|nr:hypothetical protein [uncultured Roseovarius sp.]